MIGKVMLLLLSAIMATYVSSEVSVIGQPITIYDRTPKLRIRMTDLSTIKNDEITIELASSTGNLKQDKDFILSVAEGNDGFILKLLTSRKWVDLTDRVPPISLMLNSVTTSKFGSKNLLGSATVVAIVFPTPTLKESTDIIYQTATNALVLKGSGYIGVKKFDIYFDPPLLNEIDYEIVTDFPPDADEIELRLRPEGKWRDEPGPLRVVGIDTGGGPVKVSGDDEGLVVAEVQADLDLHGVTVEDTDEEQVLYHDATTLKIRGEGFVPGKTVLRFDNGILGKGVNYTISAATETELTLRLTPGSSWRKNLDNLPGYLTLLAVNVGAGFVAVGPTNAKKGRTVARIFERPAVYSSLTKLFRTQTHELHIQGTGFPMVMATPQLRFRPALVEDKDYTVKSISRTELEVTLLDGREWSSGPGELVVTDVNTLGEESGWVKLPGNGVHVAQIEEDVHSDNTGGIEVYQTGQKVYQSLLQETIDITGAGFRNDITFTFAPPLVEGADFVSKFINKNRIQLSLKSGRKWAKDAGFLVVKAVKVDGKVFPLAGGEGIRVAVILEDPVIQESQENVHETQSKVVVIRGSGFTNIADVSVTVHPTVPGAYRVLSVTESEIRIQLKPDYDWLPTFLTLAESDKKVPLELYSIDTGAGEIVFDPTITIGQVVKDREGVVCDDSCDFAFDGVCDDGTADEMYYSYWEDGGYYLDDDIGGYYQDGAVATGEAYDDEYDMYDDYYKEDDNKAVSACLKGTDCTDCGGVDAIVDYSNIDTTDPDIVICTNTCPYARDGQCDDPRGANYCLLGTDCQDCGRVGADNFTAVDDNDWSGDDDDYWSFNDGLFVDQPKGLEVNRPRIPKKQVESAGAAAVFLTMLEGMVYTIGAIFAAAALYLIMRWYKGQSIPFMQVFNPDSAQADFESQPTRRMPITPDVIRT